MFIFLELRIVISILTSIFELSDFSLNIANQVPNKTCKTVQDKKCHQIPKKECETKYAKKNFEDRDKNKDQEIQRQRKTKTNTKKLNKKSKLIPVAGTRRSARAPPRRTARPFTSRSAPSNRFRTAKMNRCQETFILHIEKDFFACLLSKYLFPK